VVNQDGSWTIPVTYTVTNGGTATALNDWFDVGYLSANGVLDNSSQSNGWLNRRITTLAPGVSYIITANYITSTSTAQGSYTFFVKADGHNTSTGGTNTDNGNLVEPNETNNITSTTVTLAKPDLTIGPLIIGTIVANQDGSWTIPVTYTVTNNGTAPAQPNWNDIGYLSSNGVLDNNSQSSGSLNLRSTVLAAGASYTVTASFTTSTSTAPGNYTFFVKADGHNTGTGGTNTDNGSLVEGDETNNTASATVALARPDLAIGPLTVGSIVKNYNGSWTIRVTYTVTNNGTVPAQPNWSDLGFLSSNGVLDNNSRIYPQTYLRTTALAAGASYTQTLNFVMGTAPGYFTLFVKTDGHSNPGTYTDGGNLVEASETNNVSSASVYLH
jgi:hypothetical protein